MFDLNAPCNKEKSLGGPFISFEDRHSWERNFKFYNGPKEGSVIQDRYYWWFGYCEEGCHVVKALKMVGDKIVEKIVP